MNPAPEAAMATDSLVSPTKSTNVRLKIPLPVRVGIQALDWFSRFFPQTGTRAAEVLWTSPRRFDRPEREEEWLVAAERILIPYGMTGIQGYVWGADNSPTVLLMHGWEGRGSQMAAFAEPLVQQGFRVIAWDVPGHGDSEGSRASLVTFSDTVLAAIRHYGPVHGIIAHSFGGAGTTYALSAGIHVPKVAFVAPVDPAVGARRSMRFLGLGEDLAQRLQVGMEQRFGLRFSEIAGPKLAPQMTGELLVVHDEGDHVVPDADGEAYVSAWPNATRLRTKGLGHHRILRDSEVVQTVADFMSA